MDKACVLPNTITSLFALVSLRKNSDSVVLSTASLLQETEELVNSCKSSVCSYIGEEIDVLTALKRYLVWISEKYWRKRFTPCSYNIVVQCYRRWYSLRSGSNNYLAESFSLDPEEIKLSIILAEYGLEEAVLECYKCLKLDLSIEMTARIYWLLAHNSGLFFTSKVNHLKRFLFYEHEVSYIWTSCSCSAFNPYLSIFTLIYMRQLSFTVSS